MIKGESAWIVDKLLLKGQSVILSGTDSKATSLLALQIALTIAGGKDLFGYSTSASKILFLDADKARIKRDAQTLSAKTSATDNVSVGPENERDYVKLVREENPDLSIINLGQNKELWYSLSSLVSVIAVAGDSWPEATINNLWVLKPKSNGYVLQFQNDNISLNLQRDSGFALEPAKSLPTPTFDKLETSTPIGPKRAWTTRMNHEPLHGAPEF